MDSALLLLLLLLLRCWVWPLLRLFLLLLLLLLLLLFLHLCQLCCLLALLLLPLVSISMPLLLRCRGDHCRSCSSNRRRCSCCRISRLLLLLSCGSSRAWQRLAQL